MRWYGALQEGPQGDYTVMVTNFDNGISGGLVADDRPEHVAAFLGFIDRLVANGDEITLLTDRRGRLFRPTDPPTLWRTVVEKYASAHYDTVRPYDDDQTYYNPGSGTGGEYVDAPVRVVLLEPGAFIAMHRYLTGDPTRPDAADCARVGCRTATDEALLCALRGTMYPPSSQDLYDILAGSVESGYVGFTGYVGGSDVTWAVSTTAETPTNPDVAEFHLQHAETVAGYQGIGDIIAQTFAVLHTCERYRMALRAGARTVRPASSTNRPEGRTLTRLPLPLELPDVPDDLVRAWTSG